MDDVRKNNYLTNFQNVSISGREALTAVEKSSKPDNCEVVFATSKGTVEVIVYQTVGASSAGDYCSLAVKAATSFNGSIPQ
jgi:hypothetical protein